MPLGRGAVLRSPVVIGVVLMLVLAVIAGRRGAGDLGGTSDARIAEVLERFVAHGVAGEIARIERAIAAAAAGLGLVVGLCAEGLVRARYGASGGASRGLWRVVIENVVVCFAIESMLVLWSMAESPQLYAARWYAMGGIARTVQVLATDVLGPWGVAAIAMVAAVVYGRARRTVGVVVVSVVAGLGMLARLLAASDSGHLVGERRAATSDRVAREREGAPNILLLVVDSLRADRIDARVAPTMARLAERSSRFERAYVSLPSTLSSWVTMLTGRYAYHHGITSTFPTWEERERDFDALPHRLSRAGYATALISDSAGRLFGSIDLGFANLNTPSLDVGQLVRRRALERQTPLLPLLHSHLGRRVFPAMRELSDAADPRLLADDVASALHAMGLSRPFFLTAFFSAAHLPYAAPAPYYAKHTERAYRGRFKYDTRALVDGEERSVASEIDAADMAQIRALYDGAVSAVDAAVARVLASLEREGLAESTVVVVTADHGETLFENGHGLGHGDHLFGDEGTHVPLLIVDPRAGAKTSRPVRIAGVVRDVDLAPTLYELAGVAPPSDLDGRSLVRAMEGTAEREPRLAHAETELWLKERVSGLSPELRLPYPGILELTEVDTRHHGEIVLRRSMAPITRMARHRMVRDERWKLVYVPTRTGAQYRLFDTLADPGETRDVAVFAAGELERLRAELWAWMLRDPTMEQRDGLLLPRLAIPSP